MKFPPERILGKHLVERVQEQRDRGAIPLEAERLYLMSLLLADKNGVLSKDDIDVRAPALLELGTIDVRPFERDPDYVRVRFVPHQRPRRR